MNTAVVDAAPAAPSCAPVARTARSAVLVAAALVVALLVALVHPGTAQARSAAPARTATELRIAKATQRLLNTERALHHLPALAMQSHLMSAARSHNLAMAKANTMAHQLAGEPNLGKRLDRAGYKWTWAGENIGWNNRMNMAGVLTLEKLMYNEVAPNNGHRLNILNTRFQQVGVDVYLDKKHHKVWLTVDFGRP